MCPVKGDTHTLAYMQHYTHLETTTKETFNADISVERKESCCSIGFAGNNDLDSIEFSAAATIATIALLLKKRNILRNRPKPNHHLLLPV
jgi:hypothetical protein